MHRALDILVGLVSVAVVIFAKLPNPADPDTVPLACVLGSFLTAVYYGAKQMDQDDDLIEKSLWGGILGTGIGFFVYLYALIIGLYS